MKEAAGVDGLRMTGNGWWSLTWPWQDERDRDNVGTYISRNAAYWLSFYLNLGSLDARLNGEHLKYRGYLNKMNVSNSIKGLNIDIPIKKT